MSIEQKGVPENCERSGGYECGSICHLVSKDKDLLVLEKPFGIEILTPHRFLAQFA